MSDGMIGTGDSVSDSATGIAVVGFSPYASSNNTGMVLGGWGLTVDYTLAGTAIVAPDPSLSGAINYIGDFTTGSIALNLTNLAGNVTHNLFTADYTHATSTPPFDSSVIISFFANIDLSSLASDVFYFGDNTKFEDRLAAGSVITVKAGGNLSQIDEAPEQVGTSTTYTRQTTPGSYDVSVVPEPASLAIMGLGLLGFAASRKRS